MYKDKRFVRAYYEGMRDALMVDVRARAGADDVVIIFTDDTYGVQDELKQELYLPRNKAGLYAKSFKDIADRLEELSNERSKTPH